MSEWRPVVLVIGLLLVGLAAAMLAPLAVDLVDRNPDAQAFAWSAAVTSFAGGALALAARGPVSEITVRAAFLLTASSWAVMAAFASAPFVFAGIGLSFADAYFESMSGLTTTGATVITGLDTKPPGILLWRAILQWIGGIGIVVTAIAILPLLRVGGMQLFRLEFSDKTEKPLPRAAQIAGFIGGVYLGLTILCAAVYAALGMPGFHAIAHAMTTIATGGFSTSDGSMGAFMIHGADVAATFFMLAAAIPFGVYMLALRGRPGAVWRDSQARTFLAVVAVFTAVMTLHLVTSGRYGELDALRYASFSVVSVITGTGYATTAYDGWGPFALAFFFVLMFIGGCAGSTSCGIKIFRFQVAAAALKQYLSTMTRPHRIEPLRYGGRKMAEGAVYSVLNFFFLFMLSFAALAILLSAMGLDTLTALSSAATAIANVGPGLGPTVGPAYTFAPLPDAAKWALSAGMLVGRLEVLTVLVLFAPSFWRS